MFDWSVLAILLCTVLIAWMLIQVFLRGPSLTAYDQPLAQRRATERDSPSPEHQQVRVLLEQAMAEIRAVPSRERLPVVRKVVERGLGPAPPLSTEGGYRIQPTTVNGISAEWVLAPHSDAQRRLLYLHGGAFICGSPTSHRIVTTALARVTGAAVLVLDYRLMPEHTRRDLIADCQTGYRWILEHGPDGMSPVRELFVAGDSAGGGLTLTLLAWARDSGLRQADGAIALSPTVDMTLSSPSFATNRATDWMLGPSLGWVLKIPRSLRLLMTWGMNRIMPPNPLVSPIFGDLSKLPPLLIQASEAEMLLDDAQRYVNKARAAGSPAQLQTWPGLVHVWHLFAPLVPEAEEAFAKIGEFVRRCIEDQS